MAQAPLAQPRQLGRLATAALALPVQSLVQASRGRLVVVVEQSLELWARVVPAVVVTEQPEATMVQARPSTLAAVGEVAGRLDAAEAAAAAAL